MAKLVPGKGYKRKGEKTQAKYLSGLTGDARKAREKEIVRRSKLARKDPDNPVLSKPLPGDKAAQKKGTKRSSWTVAYKKKYGEDSGGSPDRVAKDTGIPASITRKVYSRGVAAAKTAGHRPGVTKPQWGLARLYAFVMKAKHNMKPLDHDHDLAIEAGLARKTESEYDSSIVLETSMFRNLLETEIRAHAPAPILAESDSENEDIDLGWDDAFAALSEWESIDLDALAEARKKKAFGEGADIAAAKQDVESSVKHTRQFIRSMDKIMSAAQDLANQARKDANKTKRIGKLRGQRRSSYQNQMRAMDREVKGLYGHFKEGREAMKAAAKKMGVSTRRSGSGGRKYSIPAGDISSTGLGRDIARVSAAMVPALRTTAEDGAATLRMGEALAKQMGSAEPSSYEAAFNEWVQKFLDYRDGVSHSIYKLMGAVVKRANEMGKRLFSGTESEECFQIELPWLEDEDYLAGLDLDEARSNKSQVIFESAPAVIDVVVGTGAGASYVTLMNAPAASRMVVKYRGEGMTGPEAGRAQKALMKVMTDAANAYDAAVYKHLRNAGFARTVRESVEDAEFDIEEKFAYGRANSELKKAMGALDVVANAIELAVPDLTDKVQQKKAMRHEDFIRNMRKDLDGVWHDLRDISMFKGA